MLQLFYGHANKVVAVVECLFVCFFLKVRGRRHLIFASDQQLYVLSRAKMWYVDGPFKFCRQPFQQLLTMNTFARSDDHVTQISLVTERKLKNVQRKTYRMIQSKVFKFWEEYEAGERSAKRL